MKLSPFNHFMNDSNVIICFTFTDQTDYTDYRNIMQIKSSDQL